MELSLRLVKSLERIDHKLLVVSGLGIFLFGGVLLQDTLILDFLKKRESGEVIGQIVTTQNDVRRRAARSLTWYNTSEKESLFEKDSLFTGSDSTLSIELKNSQQLEISSNSLIVLHATGNTLLLDLKIGSVSTFGVDNQNIKVLNDGVITEVKAEAGASPIVIRKDKSGGLAVSSRTGDVVIKKGNKKAIIKKNEVKTVEQVMSNVSPEPEPRLEFANRESLDEILPMGVPLEEPTVEKPILQEASLEKPKVEVAVEEVLPTLATDAIPKLINPNKKTILKFKDVIDPRSPAQIEKIVNPPKLKWQAIDNASDYVVEISKNEIFEDPVFVDTTPAAETSWKEVVPGKYFWRVRAQGKRGEQSNYSESGSLTVELPKPVLLARDIRNELTEVPSELNKEKEFAIQWSEVPMAKRYRFIASIADKPVKELFLKGNETTVNIPPNTDIKVKVFAVDQAGASISQAAQQEFSYKRDLVLKKPKAVLPDDNTTVMALNKNQMPPLLFAWQKNKFAENYELQFSADPTFSNILFQKNLVANRFLLQERILEKQIYWRVRSRFQSYTSDWSEVRSFDLKSSF